ncbi:MAG: DUF721 domain-containing protein [Flavobacteriaceae bacterium]|nr:DUF721 domain-containing protein [Flavobacteriaceae bacterium]MCY4215575.1 DUF721 domain-containing protein [Flavobacteriaceae bacterium]MCY4253355.1 DUF721 domain-containing protein [Flavobacteriaceae bacterium]
MSKQVPRKASHPTPLSTLVEKYKQRKNLKTGVEKIKVFKTWNEVIGDNLSPFSRVKEFAWDTLYVETKNPTITQELFYRKETILEKLNEKLEDQIVKDIKIQTNSSLFEK